MKRLQRALSAALAGAVAVVAIEAVLLPSYLIANLDYAPRLAADFVIEHTPPNNAIALQNSLGAFAMPWAQTGGIMLVALLGLFAGLLYTGFRPRSRWLALIAASLLQPALLFFCFPNMTAFALAPFLLTGPLLDLITRRTKSAAPTVDTISDPSRRQLLGRLGVFVFGGVALSLISGVPVYVSELRALRSGKRLFDFTPPAARVMGFELDGLSPEVTALDDFYKMRKSPTAVPTVPPDWKLTIDGLVDHPITLSMDDLLNFPRTDVYLTRQCVSNPVGGNLISSALVSGVPLSTVLTQAGIKPGVVDLVFYGRDGYSESVPLQYALDHGFLCYAMDGVFLPDIHGAPVRIEMRGLYGFKSMKWLDRIEAADHHVVAIWEQEGWTKDATVKTMSRIDTILPKGEPASGAVIAGIAYAGLRGIKSVEVQINGGAWLPATLNIPPLSDQMWVQWRIETAVRGNLNVTVRATDGTGAPQSNTVQGQFPDGASGLHTMSATV